MLDTCCPVNYYLLDEIRRTHHSIPKLIRRGSASLKALVYSVARLSNGVQAVDGEVHKDMRHHWLTIDGDPDFIIDLIPVYYSPGPLIVDVRPLNGFGWYKSSGQTSREQDRSFHARVDEIVEATEAAKRFLGTP